MFRRICNPAVSNCGFAIRTYPNIYLMAVWFERIANPPKHITDSRTCSRVSYINRQSSTWQSSSLPWGGLGWVSNMPSFALQKAVNRTLKGHLLQAKRRHIANLLAANALRKAALQPDLRPKPSGTRTGKHPYPNPWRTQIKTASLADLTSVKSALTHKKQRLYFAFRSVCITFALHI